MVTKHDTFTDLVIKAGIARWAIQALGYFGPNQFRDQKVYVKEGVIIEISCLHKSHYLLEF